MHCINIMDEIEQEVKKIDDIVAVAMAESNENTNNSSDLKTVSTSNTVVEGNFSDIVETKLKDSDKLYWGQSLGALADMDDNKRVEINRNTLVDVLLKDKVPVRDEMPLAAEYIVENATSYGIPTFIAHKAANIYKGDPDEYDRIMTTFINEKFIPMHYKDVLPQNRSKKEFE